GQILAEVNPHRVEIFVVPRRAVLFALALRNLGVEDRDPRAPADRLEMDLDPRVGGIFREVGRAPAHDDTPPRSEGDELAADVSVERSVFRADLRIELRRRARHRRMLLAVDPREVERRRRSRDRRRDAKGLLLHASRVLRRASPEPIYAERT